MEKIELLAPAGNMESFRAAVENGANAVYLGGSMFSARQYANNFAGEELKDAVDFAHSRNVRTYVAVNTLIANNELKELVSYAYELAQYQVDGIIVQDLGAAAFIRNVLPEMELHASTQMAVHNSEGIKFLEKMGFTRGVLAREVSFENIKLIKEKTYLELETFVHGALCFAYSGQCLMSSMIGGRSGNRGRCAQPCRMKYSLVDSLGKQLIDPACVGEHLLSPKDLKMIQHIPQLISAGIVSLKIEGRMKRPEYVATVVRNYREAIDRYYSNPHDFSISKEEEKELEQIFNRDFTTGYYFGNQGKDLMSYKRPNNRGLLLGRISQVEQNLIKIKLVEELGVGDGYEVWVTKGGRIAGEVKEIFLGKNLISRAYPGQEAAIKVSGKPRVGDRIFKTHDSQLMQKAKESYLSPKISRKIGLNLEISIEEDKAVSVLGWDDEGYSFSGQGSYIVERAHKHPINYETVSKQFSRLGNTPFELKNLTVKLDSELIVPVSEFNNLRRQVVEGLLTARQANHYKKIPDKKAYLQNVSHLFNKIPKPKFVDSKPLLSITVGNMAALKEAIDGGADQVYLTWEGFKNKPKFSIEDYKEAINICRGRGRKAVLYLPRLFSEAKMNKFKADLDKIKSLNFDGLLVGNLGTLNLAMEQNFANILIDFTLNVFNDLTILKLRESNCSQITLSPELNLQQINDFSFLGNIPLEAIVHGNYPLMVSEHCTVGSVLGNKSFRNPCSGACTGGNFGLKDRMKFVFPIEMDENCRMLIYNAKPLNLFKDIKKILAAGINSIRIEGQKEDPKWLRTTTQAYRNAIDKWYQNRDSYEPSEGLNDRLLELQPEGFTTGHFFRGVL
ncbi:MAG: DUF3656 domain-containing U32 family peptidase [Bacillota bacterium]